MPLEVTNIFYGNKAVSEYQYHTILIPLPQANALLTIDPTIITIVITHMMPAQA